MLRILTCLLAISLLVVSCAKDEIDSIAPPLEKETEPEDREIVSPTVFKDLGSMEIAVDANGNYWGGNDIALIRNISGMRYSYCHPDVEYFANGLYGYKYWMVFTPYFGQVGSSGNAILYENPTVVVSNDALHWASPSGLINPIQRPPMKEDGELDNTQVARQGYWSDVDWMYCNGQFELYYRGNGVSQRSLERICSSSPNNIRKLSAVSAGRNIVRQTSVEGVKWSPVEIAYTSNYPATLLDNHVISPSFVKVGLERFLTKLTLIPEKRGTRSRTRLLFYSGGLQMDLILRILKKVSLLTLSINPGFLLIRIIPRGICTLVIMMGTISLRWR